MTNQQRLVVALVFVVALVGGGALALLLTGGGDETGASPSPVAQASPSGAASPSASTGPSASAEASPSDAPAPTEAPTQAPPTDEPTPTPTPRPTTPPGIPTTVVVTGFQLDAAADPDGSDRRLVFRSQGAGEITVSVRLLSPQGGVRACLYASGDRIRCPDLGSVTATTTKRREDFELELRGEGIETPEVEVTITFPARSPFLEIHDARFDGTSFPQTNGINVLVNPRAAGDVTLQAEWGGHPFSYEVDLFQLDGPGTQVLANQGPDVRTDVALQVVAGEWRLLLQNIDEGFGVTPLDAVVGWP
jgi:hypothetical protein